MEPKDFKAGLLIMEHFGNVKWKCETFAGAEVLTIYTDTASEAFDRHRDSLRVALRCFAEYRNLGIIQGRI